MAKKSVRRRVFVVVIFIAGILIIWYELKRTTRFVHYAAFGIDIPANYAVHGIDISKYQSGIDWQEVGAMQVENIRINFVFIKATEGISRQDNQFVRNWRQARKAGITRGAYHFFYSTRDPLLQAKNFESMVQLEPGDLPPVLDIEVSNGQPDSIIQRTARIWLEEIARYYGVQPIIYTNMRFYEKHLGKAFDSYPLWISHYYKDRRPRSSRDWLFWQHSDSGHVNGISVPVDFNVFNGDTDDFQKILLE